jgi:hypothetical protein
MAIREIREKHKRLAERSVDFLVIIGKLDLDNGSRGWRVA